MSKHVGFGIPCRHAEATDEHTRDATNLDVPDEKQEHSRIPSFGVGTGHSSTKSGGSREVSSVKERLDLQKAGYGEVNDSERQPLLHTGGSRSGENNDNFEKHGVGVATFFDSDNQRKEYSKHGQHGQSGSDQSQTESHSTYGSDQRGQNLRGSSNEQDRHGVASFFDSDNQHIEHSKHDHHGQSGSDQSQTESHSTYGSDQRGQSIRGSSNKQDRHLSNSERHDVYAKDADLGATRKATVPLGDNDNVPMELPTINEQDSPAPFSTAALTKSSQYNSNDPTGLYIHHHP